MRKGASEDSLRVGTCWSFTECNQSSRRGWLPVGGTILLSFCLNEACSEAALRAPFSAPLSLSPKTRNTFISPGQPEVSGIRWTSFLYCTDSQPFIATESPGRLLNHGLLDPTPKSIPLQSVWVGDHRSAFLTSFKAMLTLPVWSPHVENHCCTQRGESVQGHYPHMACPVPLQQ